MRRFFLCAFLTAVGFAADINVPPNQTTTQTLTDDGDTLTVASDGSIVTTGTSVQMQNTNQTVSNAGTISSSTGANTISSSADLALIINDGAVANTAGLNGDAIRASAATPTIINRGTITHSADDSQGIDVGAATAASITNSGTITSSGFGAAGILAGNATSITNSGLITNSGNASQGIRVSGAAVSITNSGTILVTGVNSIGVLSNGANTTLTNSGTIKSAQSHALRFTSTNPTVSLLLGSNLQGTITSTSPLNLTVQDGLNLRFTIDDDSNGFGALNIDSPYVTVGNTETVAVVDRTGLALQADVLEDTTDSILDDIFRREYFYLHCCYPDCGYWGEGIGAYRKRTDSIHYHDWLGGGVAGLNWEAYCGSFGIFGGGTYGEAKIAEDTQKAKITTGFGGFMYEQMYRNAFVAFAMEAGYVNWKNRRTVMNNLAPGGVQEARADVNGWMIAPEVSSAAWISLSHSWSTLISGTFRYSGLFLGSYGESGSGADLSVNNRHVDLLKLRGELALSGRKNCGRFCWNLAPYIGVAGRFQVGGARVHGEMLGQDLSFSTRVPRNLAELLFGVRGEEVIGQWVLFGNVQGLFDNKNSSRILGELGLSRNF